MEAEGEESGTQPRSRTALDALYDEFYPEGSEVRLCFEPMLPRVYDIMLPSLDARLNLISVGKKYAALLRYVHVGGVQCAHREVIQQKVKVLAAIITKLLDVNGILERKTDGT